MTLYSQRDPQWANTKLGTSAVTIGAYGCTITCLAMMADITPAEVNEKMKAVGGYAQGNLVIWAKIAEALPDMACTEIGWNYNNEIVKANVPCMVEVDGAPIGGTRHWVVYIGGGKIYDPWDGKEKATTAYNALSYRLIKGAYKKSVTNSPTPPMTDKRPYWFDLINGVTFKTAWEKLTDSLVNQFVKDYPGQQKRSGEFDKVCRALGLSGDTNAMTASMLLAVAKEKYQGYDEQTVRKDERQKTISEVQRVVGKLNG